MFIASLTLSVFLLIGGGVVMSYDENIAFGLYLSAPVPLIVRKAIQWYHSEPKQEPKQESLSEDPVAPTPDEPSAV